MTLLLFLSIQSYSQTLSEATIPAVVQAQADSMQIMLGLDSVQKHQVKQIQATYYTNYLSIPDTASPTWRRARFLQYTQHRDSLTKLVLTPVQWTTHDNWMKEREQQVKQRVLNRRAQHQY